MFKDQVNIYNINCKNFYILDSNIISNTFDQNLNNHWFILRDPKKLVYLAWVKFSCNKENITCRVCNEQKLQDIRYCHNDEAYFCSGCDEEFHSKFNTRKKHRRTNYTSFSINHQTMCSEHNTKPYEFYCFKCRAVYCIKCLNEGLHKNYIDHEVKFLNDVYLSFESEIKAVIFKLYF